MKKFLAVAGSAAFLLAPALALAAYNDVTLTTATVINVGGILLDVSGSSAAISSITVNASNFTVDMDNGSSIKVTAPGLNQIDVAFPTIVPKTIVCSASESSVSVTSNLTQTVTFTPKSDLCGAAAPAPAAAGNGPVGGGGGGGGGSIAAPTAPGTTPITQTGTPGATGTLAQLQAQLNTLLAQISALTGGNANPSANAYANANANASFKRNLTVGTTGADVQSLQAYLNAHGYTVAASGAGSTGNETTMFGNATRAALIKLQKAAGITPASGYFGPKTRAYIAANP